MKFSILFISALVLFSETACAISFKPADASGVTKAQKVSVTLVGRSTDWNDLPEISGIIQNGPQELRQAVNDTCESVPNQKFLPPAAIPLVTAAGTLLYNLYMDRKSNKLDLIEKNRVNSYSGSVFMTPVELKGKKCGIITRSSVEDRKTGFIAIFKIKNYENGAAFNFVPTFVKANDSISVTQKGTKDEPAKINAAIAVAVKALGKGKGGQPAMVDVGHAAVSLPNLSLGSNTGAYVCRSDCTGSGLVPYPANSKVATVSIAVTETGKVPYDVDYKKAQLKAIKAAIGPAIGSSLKEALSE